MIEVDENLSCIKDYIDSIEENVDDFSSIAFAEEFEKKADFYFGTFDELWGKYVKSKAARTRTRARARASTRVRTN